MAKVTIDLSAMQGIAEASARRGLEKAVLVGQRVLQASYGGERSGRVYRRGKTKTHQASAPGEAPANDYGNLRQKTQADQVIARDGDSLVGRIVANTNYAEALEVGTERMAARPYLSTLKTDHSDELFAAFLAGAKED